MTATTFQLGDEIVARVTAQGMVAGLRYRVAELHVRDTAFGVFVTYVLFREGQRLAVCNLHLLARQASEEVQP